MDEPDDKQQEIEELKKLISRLEAELQSLKQHESEESDD
jgi:hypothetical protein